jgi:hypothetical protein
MRPIVIVFPSQPVDMGMEERNLISAGGCDRTPEERQGKNGSSVIVLRDTWLRLSTTLYLFYLLYIHA